MKYKIDSMSLEDLIYNLDILADLEAIRAEESGDYTRETACYYRESILREAMRRLADDTVPTN